MPRCGTETCACALAQRGAAGSEEQASRPNGPHIARSLHCGAESVRCARRRVSTNCYLRSSGAGSSVRERREVPRAAPRCGTKNVRPRSRRGAGRARVAGGPMDKVCLHVHARFWGLRRRAAHADGQCACGVAAGGVSAWNRTVGMAAPPNRVAAPDEPPDAPRPPQGVGWSKLTWSKSRNSWYW